MISGEIEVFIRANMCNITSEIRKGSLKLEPANLEPSSTLENVSMFLVGTDSVKNIFP